MLPAQSATSVADAARPAGWFLEYFEGFGAGFYGVVTGLLYGSTGLSCVLFVFLLVGLR